jgi:hypothetical protein
MAGTLPCRLLAVDSFEACWAALGQYGADSVVCASHGGQVENCEAYSSHCPGIPSFFASRPHKTPSSGLILEILCDLPVAALPASAVMIWIPSPRVEENPPMALPLEAPDQPNGCSFSFATTRRPSQSRRQTGAGIPLRARRRTVLPRAHPGPG